MVLRRVFYLALAAMMAFMVSCNDKDEEQPTPTPEPTPVIPTKEITLDWTWNEFNNSNIVSKDTIKKYTDMEDVKFVFLNLVNEDIADESSYNTRKFHRAQDTLQTRFDISEKVRGSGIIYVDKDVGAQLPDGVSGTGMNVSDSTWFASKGYQIKRYSAQNSK